MSKKLNIFFKNNKKVILASAVSVFAALTLSLSVSFCFGDKFSKSVLADDSWAGVSLSGEIAIQF